MVLWICLIWLVFIALAINTLAKAEMCLPGNDTKVRVKSAVAIFNTEKIEMNFFKKLIDHDQHPMILVESEWGEPREQWWQPIKGGVPHIAQVVGYGEGVNPVTLKKEPYVIVRDSIYMPLKYRKPKDSKPIPTHRWVSFDDLKGTLQGVVKINKIDINSNSDEN